MNSDQVFDIVKSVADVKGKLKASLLALLDEDGQKVLRYTYDPLKTFGLKKIEDRAPDAAGDQTFDAETWRLLDALSERELTGDAARCRVQSEINRLSPDSAELLRRVIKKDMLAGFSAGTTNKVFPDLVPEVPYMRCSLPKDAKVNSFDWAVGCFSQLKADGMFANANLSADGQLRVLTRQGQEFEPSLLGAVATEMSDRLIKGTQTHGELLVLREGKTLPREISNGVMNAVLNGTPPETGDQVVYHVWDQIPLNKAVPGGVYEQGYGGRFWTLVDALAGREGRDSTPALLGKCPTETLIMPIETEVVSSLADAKEHYKRVLRSGREGTVVKCPSGVWKDATSKFQVKFKLTFDCDLEFVEFVPGKEGGKNANTFGSMLLQTSDGLLQVAVSGIKDADRLALFNRKDSLDGVVFTVKANGIMYPSESNDLYSLFLPRLVEERKDKRTADTLERVQAQMEAAIDAAE